MLSVACSSAMLKNKVAYQDKEKRG